MHVDYGNMLKQFQQILVHNFREISLHHLHPLFIFSISVHPFKTLFHGEMHMDDGNMPNKFQQIIVHGFQEIDLHFLKPFLVFLEIRASIGQHLFMGRCIMMMETCLENFRSIHFTVWEIWEKQVCYKRLSWITIGSLQEGREESTRNNMMEKWIKRSHIL